MMERRLAAILAADVVGYSRLMEQDEVGTLSAFRSLQRELIDPTLAERPRQSSGNLLNHVVLDREDIADIAIISLRPNMPAVLRIDELGG